MATRVLIAVLFVLVILTSSALTYLVFNQDTKTPTSQVSAPSINIAKEIEDFITKNPQVIIDGLRKAQAEKEKQEAEIAEKKAKELRPQLEKAAGDGTAGNKDGDVTMVVFHDQNCGFCKRSIPDIIKLVQDDTNLKLVVKDFPILGPLSVDKAKASLAIAKIAPEKWVEYYQESGKSNPQNVDQIIDMVNKKLGIDANLLRSEMESKEILNKLAENRALGEQLGVQGTPFFIINGNVIRGAAGYEVFKQAVAAARAGKGAPAAAPVAAVEPKAN